MQIDVYIFENKVDLSAIKGERPLYSLSPSLSKRVFMSDVKSRLQRIAYNIIGLFLVLNFILIVIYVLTGGFTYAHIRIAGTFLEMHSLWRPLLVFIVLWCCLLLFKRLNNKTIRVFPFKQPIYYLISSILLYNAFLIPFVLFRYYSFSFPWPDDLAVYHQTLFNTIRGYPLMISSLGYIPAAWNALADHFVLIMLFLAPFYYFWQDAGFLLVVQVLVISLGAIPIYYIAKNQLQSKWIGLLISLVYLLFPVINGIYFFEFRYDSLAMVLLLYSFLCIEYNKIYQRS